MTLVTCLVTDVNDWDNAATGAVRKRLQGAPRSSEADIAFRRYTRASLMEPRYRPPPENQRDYVSSRNSLSCSLRRGSRDSLNLFPIKHSKSKEDAAGRDNEPPPDATLLVVKVSRTAPIS